MIPAITKRTMLDTCSNSTIVDGNAGISIWAQANHRYGIKTKLRTTTVKKIMIGTQWYQFNRLFPLTVYLARS